MVDIIVGITGIGAVVIVAIIAAVLLRHLRCPGAAIVAGTLIGVLAGPTILGRIAPQTFERTFLGAVAEREARDALARAHQRDLIAADAAIVDPEVRSEMLVERDAAMAEVTADWRTAVRTYQRPQRVAIGLLVWALLLMGGRARRTSDTGGPAHPVIVGSIGVWSAALPAGIAFMLLTRLWGFELPHALLAAAAVGIGPWMLTGADLRAADEAEYGGARMMGAAGRIASVLALAAAAVAIALDPVATWPWIVVLLAMPLGWLAPWRHPTLTRPWVGEMMLLPALAALAALRVELFEHWKWWPVIAFILLSGDGRWLGALIGALLPGGRRVLRTMRLVLGVMAAGPTQLCLAAILGYATDAPPELLPALLAGAVLVEVTAPMRRSAARRIVETETMLEEEEEEEDA